jgi:hypothetical protein
MNPPKNKEKRNMAKIKSPSEIINEICPVYNPKKRPSAVEFKIIYDSSSETLEPVYFWILDFIKDTLTYKEVEKLVDSFASSVGSGHFSELMGKATRMQEEAMKIYGMVNTVIKSIINIIYDLKEFKIRLAMYEDAKSKDPQTKSAAIRNLKQLWMDQVDVKKGAGSINMMAQQLNFVTLRDSFMSANSLEEAGRVDLNDRVKRVLEARLAEFLNWKDESELELRKRYDIEKTYLKTQVDTVTMYSNWAKPYLIAAEQLRMSGDGTNLKNPSVINTFNTIYLQLTLLATKKFDVAGNSLGSGHALPSGFKNLKMKRDYYQCMLVDLVFRGIPRNVGQHYAFGGRVEVSFKAYSLNEEELFLLKEKLKESDLNNTLELVSGMTKESLEKLDKDIKEFLKDKKEEKEEKNDSDVNPFLALLGLGKNKEEKKEDKKETPKEKAKKEKEEKIKKTGKIESDNYAEKLVRKNAELVAMKHLFTLYDVYKKSHGMASQPIADYNAMFLPIDMNVRFTDIFKK